MAPRTRCWQQCDPSQSWELGSRGKGEAGITRAPPSCPSRFLLLQPRPPPPTSLTLGLHVEEDGLRPGPIPGQRGGLDPGCVVARVQPVQLGPSVLPVILPGHTFPLVLGQTERMGQLPTNTRERGAPRCPISPLPPNKDPRVQQKGRKHVFNHSLPGTLSIPTF